MKLLPCDINLKLLLEKAKLEILVSTSQVALDIKREKLCKVLIKFSAFGQREIQAEYRNERKHLKQLLPKCIRNIIWTICISFRSQRRRTKCSCRFFIVVVGTEFQRHLMQKFANKRICCDSTHGTTDKQTIRIYYVCKQTFYISQACISQKVKVFPFEN